MSPFHSTPVLMLRVSVCTYRFLFHLTWAFSRKEKPTINLPRYCIPQSLTATPDVVSFIMESCFWSFLWVAVYGRLSHPFVFISSVSWSPFWSPTCPSLAWLTRLSACASPRHPLGTLLPLSSVWFPLPASLSWVPPLFWWNIAPRHLVEHQDTKTTFLAPSEMVHGRLIFTDLTYMKMSHIWLIIWLGIEVCVGDGFPSSFFFFLLLLLAVPHGRSSLQRGGALIAVWEVLAATCGIWFSDQVWNPGPQRFNHWPTKAVPSFQFLKAVFPYNILWVFSFI